MSLKVDFSDVGLVVLGLMVWGFIALITDITFNLNIAGMILIAILIVTMVEHLLKLLFYVVRK